LKFYTFANETTENCAKRPKAETAQNLIIENEKKLKINFMTKTSDFCHKKDDNNNRMEQNRDTIAASKNS